MKKQNTFITALLLLLTQISFAQEQDSISASYKKIAAFDHLKIGIDDTSSVVKLVLKGKRISAVPPEVFTLTRLEYLDLSGNKLDSLPRDIAKLINLKVLLLEGNKLESLPEEIYQLKNLQVLRLGRNNIFYIGAHIKQMQAVEILDLWNNNVAEFPEELSEIPHLKVLDLRSVSMNDEQQFQIMKLLPNTKVLMDVSCNCN